MSLHCKIPAIRFPQNPHFLIYKWIPKHLSPITHPLKDHLLLYMFVFIPSTCFQPSLAYTVSNHPNSYSLYSRPLN